jgi:hypothetical protein
MNHGRLLLKALKYGSYEFFGFYIKKIMPRDIFSSSE